MMNGMFCWLILAVQLATPPGAVGGGDGAAAQPPADGGMWSGMLTFLPMMFAIMFIYILLMQKPKQREQARTQQLLNELKRNDRVITAGGILGTVVNVSGDSEYVTLRIDESNNTKLQVLKQSIIRVVKDSDSAKEASSKLAQTS